MASRSSLLLSLALGTVASPPWGGAQDKSASCWDLAKFTSLVTFGDSYTDDSRLGYFIANGTAPPVGYDNPANYESASGGRPWPQYVKQYADVNLYNYAVAGAVCSNDLTPRDLTPGVPFPDIQGYELPAFLADSKYTKPDGTKFMTNPPDETVYSMWIGTNDVGGIGFLGDNQIPGTDLVNYTDCVYAQFKRLYDAGGRYFVLQNLAPLNLAPLYATPEMGGVEQSYFWTFKPDNVTRTAYRMEEQVATVNQIFDLQTPFVRVISREFPDARFAVMDMRALLADVYYRPEGYLNGTGSPVVQDFAKKCNATGGDCVVAADPDRFLWYDSLHPSEQTDRVIAREFVEVVKGSSRWATYW